MERVCLDLRLAVLHHNHSVTVIRIDDGESICRQSIEETFLGITIVLERSMIVEMVASQVGEDASTEVETSYTLWLTL